MHYINTDIHTLIAAKAMQITYLGFSVLPKDTSTCIQGKLGFKPPTHRSLDNLLYLLSHSRPC